MVELAEEFDQKQNQSVLLEHVSCNRAEQLALLPDIRKRLMFVLLSHWKFTIISFMHVY